MADNNSRLAAAAAYVPPDNEIILVFDLDETLMHQSFEEKRVKINKRLIDLIQLAVVSTKPTTLIMYTNNNSMRYIKFADFSLGEIITGIRQPLFNAIIYRSGFMTYTSEPESEPIHHDMEPYRSSRITKILRNKGFGPPMKTRDELEAVITSYLGKRYANIFFFDDLEHPLRTNTPAVTFIKITPPFERISEYYQEPKTDYSSVLTALGFPPDSLDTTDRFSEVFQPALNLHKARFTSATANVLEPIPFGNMAGGKRKTKKAKRKSLKCK